MPKLTREEQAARKEFVLAGARRCFARFGYQGATVVRLEEEIGLSRGAIFNWFPSKQELFLALAGEDYEALNATLVADGFEGVLTAILEYDRDWLSVYLEFSRQLQNDPTLRRRWGDRSPQVEEASLGWIVARQESGEFRSDVRAEDIAKFFGLVIDGAASRRAAGFDDLDRAAVMLLTMDAVGGREHRSGNRSAGSAPG